MEIWYLVTQNKYTNQLRVFYGFSLYSPINGTCYLTFAVYIVTCKHFTNISVLTNIFNGTGAKSNVNLLLIFHPFMRSY